MEYLQYSHYLKARWGYLSESFKPYYKWNTFNTFGYNECMARCVYSFKPYYKWNTFNTLQKGVSPHSTHCGF